MVQPSPHSSGYSPPMKLSLIAVILSLLTLQPHASRLTEFNTWYNEITNTPNIVSAAPTHSDAGNSVVVGVRVREGETVLSVPLRWVVCSATLRSRVPRLGPLLDASEPAGMALFLMEQRVNPSSEFAPWMAVLPRKLHPPHLWKRDILSLLDGDPEAHKVADHKAKIRQEYRNHVIPFLVQQKIDPTDKPYAFKRYVWARYLIDSRAWFLSGVRYMAPMAGMFNFAPSALQKASGSRHATRGELFARSHRVENNAVVMDAESSVGPGDELTESYGDNPNSIYLVYHGFVPLENPDECVPLPLPPFSPSSHPIFHRHLVDLVKAMGIRRKSSVCVYAPSSPRPTIPDNAKLLLSLAALDEDDAAAVAKAYARDPSGTRRKLVAYAESWPFTTLRSAASRLLAGYPSTLDQDRIRGADLAAIAPDSRSRDETRELMARRFLITRKEILVAVRDHDVGKVGHPLRPSSIQSSSRSTKDLSRRDGGEDEDEEERERERERRREKRREMKRRKRKRRHGG